MPVPVSRPNATYDKLQQYLQSGNKNIAGAAQNFIDSRSGSGGIVAGGGSPYIGFGLTNPTQINSNTGYNGQLTSNGRSSTSGSSSSGGLGGYSTPSTSSSSSSSSNNSNTNNNFSSAIADYIKNLKNSNDNPSSNLYQNYLTNRNNAQGPSDFLSNLPTGFTPEQQLLMRNQAQSANQSFGRGTSDAIKSAMAAQGLGGSGAEIAAISNASMKNASNLQNVLSGIDLQNAQTGLQNQYQKAGLMEQSKQFNQGQNLDAMKWGQDTDWQRQQYLNQMQLQAMFMQMMMPNGSNSNNGSTPYNWGYSVS